MLLPRRGRARRCGLARPRLPALQGRREHDRPAGRARRALLVLAAPSSPTPALERFHALFEDDAAGASTSGSRMQALRPSTTAACSSASRRCCSHPDFSLDQPEPRAQPDRRVLHRQPGRLPSHRRRRLRVLGRPRARARRHQPAARLAHRARARSLDPARRAVPQRRARGDRARRRVARSSRATPARSSRARSRRLRLPWRPRQDRGRRTRSTRSRAASPP